jgi:2-octaprenylphenol hydroxylase
VRVALLERSSGAEAMPGEYPEVRVSAVTQASRNVIEAVGAWSFVDQRRLSPFVGMSVWDANGNARVTFDSALVGTPELGWIIENRVIQHALLRRVEQLGSVQLRTAVGLDRIAWQGHGVTVTLADGTELAAALLVGADGANSRVREFAGIGTLGWSYGQTAIVATVSSAESHNQIARQRFLSTGPLAFLPLCDGQCSIVWSTTNDEAERLLQLPDVDFEAELDEAFGHELGSLTLTSARSGFPLRLQHAQHYVQEGVALVGDAAHTIHPLAGQGVNLGLLDAAALAEVVLEAKKRGRDLASAMVLRRYERWRKGHNLLVQGLMDVFKRLFGNRIPPVRLIRNLGMALTDAAEPVKYQIMRRAMGLDGDLPTLARARGWQQSTEVLGR